ncbi:hypothetical protein FDH96_gp057 [Mycobacterium phage Rey]|uniref:Uncharacterized protein n=1 Tax=Mycobacterium phage Rey TaxID=1034115 RepID=G1D5B9_9CAUD|nr:hypothetical protein FDH96_gp057 [Mycobacterium phage Rey]AEK09969.1 hypothetical protein PBI_REY_57 [Mycobacterium phage Rey]
MFGQEITIGSVVAVGFRRSNSSSHALGVVLDMVPIPYTHYSWVPSVNGGRPWTRVSEQREWMKVKVRWIPATSEYTFISHWDVNDLVLVDDSTLDAEYRGRLDTAYEAYMLDEKKPSEFVAE